MRQWIKLFEHQLPEYLYHGTWKGHIDSIIEDGLTGPSYWGDEEIARSYADHYGKEGVIIRMPLSAFNEDGLVANEALISSLDVDDMLDGDFTWEDSLELVDSLIYEYNLSVDLDDFIQP